MQDNESEPNNQPNTDNGSQPIQSSSGDVFHPEDSANTAVPTPPTLGATENNTPEVTPQTDNKPELLGIPPKPPKKKSSKMLLFIVLLLIAITGVAAWWLSKDNKAAAPQQSKVKETLEIEHLKIGAVGGGPASVFFPDEGVLGVQSVLDAQVYEGLVGFNDKKVVPLLAESWTNPDQKTWVFKLRSGIKFHTGKPLTAKEVKASLDDLKKFDYWSLFVSTIESVEATGDLELTIKTTSPDSLLLNRLVRAYISDITVTDKPGANGTGSYKLDATATNDTKSTTLVAVDDYYGDRAKTRKLTYSIIESDAEAIKALKENKVDVVETLPYTDVSKELKDAGFTATDTETPGVFGLYMNQARSATSILKNKDLRLAIAQGLNRQELVDKIDSKNVPVTQVIPKSLPGYDSSISAPKFDEAVAKATLIKAGYKNEPLEFTYITELQDDAPILIAQLKSIGLNIKEKAFSADDIDKAVVEWRAGNFDLFAAAYSSDFGDSRDVLGGILHSTESAYSTLNDPAYDKLLADSDTEFDPIKRIVNLQLANKYIIDNLAWIPLRNSVYASFHKPNLDLKEDFSAGGSIGTYFRKVGTIAE